MMECSQKIAKNQFRNYSVVVDIFVAINMIIKSTQNRIEMISIPDQKYLELYQMKFTGIAHPYYTAPAIQTNMTHFTFLITSISLFKVE